MGRAVVARICFGLIWLGFSVYAFLLSPPPAPDTVQLVVHLSTGQWSDINPWVISLFNLMGVWPLIYCCLLFADGRGQAIPAWPFACLSFLVGAFGLLPYLALRQPHASFDMISNKAPQNAGASLGKPGSPPQLSGAADAVSSD